MGVMIETVAVTVCALAAARLLYTSHDANLQWLAIPGVLVCAALVPAWVRRREFPRLGLDLDQTRLVAGALGWVCLCVFPAVFFALWVLIRLHLPLPLHLQLRPVLLRRQRVLRAARVTPVSTSASARVRCCSLSALDT